MELAPRTAAIFMIFAILVARSRVAWGRWSRCRFSGEKLKFDLAEEHGLDAMVNKAIKLRSRRDWGRFVALATFAQKQSLSDQGDMGEIYEYAP